MADPYRPPDAGHPPAANAPPGSYPPPYSPYPPNYPPYGAPQQPYAPAPSTGQMNVFAVLSLVSAIAGFLFLAFIGPILAIVFGNMAKNEIARNPGMAGRELAQWGVILGVIVLVLQVLMLLVGLMFWSVWMDMMREGPWWTQVATAFT